MFESGAVLQQSNVDMSVIQLSMKTVVEQFIEYLRSYVSQYYSDVSPGMGSNGYARTNMLMNLISSLQFDPNLVGFNRITSEMNYHLSIPYYASRSFFGSSVDGYDVVSLINDGWSVKANVWFKERWHMGYYEGYHFIDRAISSIQATYPGVTVINTDMPVTLR